jgi:dephospho-CoA kinase
MTSHQPIILALTGGIACGKSEAGRILEKQGFAVLDTDLLAHELMRSGTPLFQQIVERFGNSVVGVDGELDRAVLGRIVFEHPEALTDLNRLVHPRVIEAAEQWKSAQAADAVVMVPLLFETGWSDGWDAVVCVSADKETVFQRLEKRGFGREEAQRRIAAQMPLSEKEDRSDFTIENCGSLDALCQEVLSVLECIRNQRKTHE